MTAGFESVNHTVVDTENEGNGFIPNMEDIEFLYSAIDKYNISHLATTLGDTIRYIMYRRDIVPNGGRGECARQLAFHAEVEGD